MNDAEKIMAITKKACEPYVVCIVDDDQAVRDALGNLLESVGLRVEAFASAEEFVNSNTVNHRSCLILDVHLPRMSGLELMDHLSRKSDTVPIIFVTAHANDEVRSRALQAGAVSFLYKPFSSKDLLSAVHSTLK
jgi:FixJ family two-component response regulator